MDLRELEACSRHPNVCLRTFLDIVIFHFYIEVCLKKSLFLGEFSTIIVIEVTVVYN